ncbi:hypothetical protein NW767_005955 [Fusarium falciforme]|nr:hypothetical protein NW767_005955 [Fusarium falciforme]
MGESWLRADSASPDGLAKAVDEDPVGLVQASFSSHFESRPPNQFEDKVKRFVLPTRPTPIADGFGNVVSFGRDVRGTTSGDVALLNGQSRVISRVESDIGGRTGADHGAWQRNLA